MENLQIRKVDVKDAEEISRIESAIMQTPTSADFRKIIGEQIRKDEDAGYVAELDGQIAGYMISYTLSVGFGIDKSAWIAIFGVDPKFMGQGIGKGLANEVLRFYKEQGIYNIYTSVRWDSTDILSFFKSLDFDRSNFINLRKVIK